MDRVTATGAICAALLAIIGLVGLIVRAALRTLRRLDDFLSDWRGEPRRPGQPRRPGVMERIERIEAQLRPNGGSSMRDRVNAIAGAVGAEPEQH